MQRILFCVPPAQFAVSEMSAGYLKALRRQGHDVAEYDMAAQIAYHRKAVPYEHQAWFRASETILQAAIYHRADLVVFVCGLSFHPIALELLAHAGFRSVALYSESPYMDPQQVAWAAHDPKLVVYSNFQGSAARHGWRYMPLAYDPDIHKPTAPDPADVCDVLFIGTGYPYRQAFFEGVDWSGIDLRLRGMWEGVTEGSPLWPYYQPGIIPNSETPRLYASAKICLNLHLAHPEGGGFNQRVYEAGAEQVFQLTDDRADQSVLSRALVRYRSQADMGEKVRYYLAHPEEREANAELIRHLVADQTYQARADEMMRQLAPTFATA